MEVTRPCASMDSTPSRRLSSSTRKRLARSSAGRVSTMRNSSRSGMRPSVSNRAARSTSLGLSASRYTKARSMPVAGPGAGPTAGDVPGAETAGGGVSLPARRSTSMETMDSACPARSEDRSETMPTLSRKMHSIRSFMRASSGTGWAWRFPVVDGAASPRSERPRGRPERTRNRRRQGTRNRARWRRWLRFRQRLRPPVRAPADACCRPWPGRWR